MRIPVMSFRVPALLCGTAFVLTMTVAAAPATSAGTPVLHCVGENYPPFVTPDLPHNGVFWETVERALATQGIRATVTFLPWARAFEETRNGNNECLLGAFRTPEREAWFAFSSPIGEVRTGFFRRRDRSDIHYTGRLAELRRWSIGVGRGYANGDAFDRATGLHKIELESSAQGIRMVYLRRLDLMTGADAVDGYTLRHALEAQYPGISQTVEFIEPPLQVQPLHVAIPKQNPHWRELLHTLDAGLAQLKASGEWQRISERHRND